jgi:uncharacterized protein YjbI with pentapeptide repeats
MIEDCTEGKLREIDAHEILDKIQNGEDVEYNGVIVKGDLDLRKLPLRAQRIKRPRFENQSKLSEDAKLVKSKIKIVKSKIDGVSFFCNIVFSNVIAFSKTVFCREANFSGSLFCEDADFHESQFRGRANFTDAQFSRYADFWYTQFQLGGSVTFYGDRFSDYADFFGARFGGDVDFDWVQFSGDAIFNDAEFSKQLSMHMTKYDRLLIDWKSIKEHLKYDSATYQLLIKNFRNLGFLEDADDCYYEYRKLSQKSKDWNWSKLLDWMAFLSCEYGVRLRFVLGWMGISIIFFGIINILSGNPAPESAFMSTMAFTASLPNNASPMSNNLRYAFVVERFLGTVLIALFVVVLTKKLIR